MSMQIQLSGFVCRSFTMAALLGAATLAASAQTAQPATTLDLSTPAYSTSAQPELTTDAPANETAVNAEHLDFLGAMNAMQYGGRRTGRPRYRGGNTNADGSQKYEFFAGGGFTAPDSDYLSTSYGFQVGAGRNFNRHLGVDIDFDYDHFGFQKGVLSNQSEVEFADTDADTGLDGNSHIWSFSIDPTYQLYSGPGLGAYLVVGGGFYHKVADFTIPSVEEYYDPYFGPEEYEANETVDDYTSNAPGVSGGIGLTYKFSRFSNEKFYAEAKVVHTFNRYRPPFIDLDVNGNVVAYNVFPQNSDETTYVPVKFGIRF